MAALSWRLILIWMPLLMVDAKPKCTTHARKEVICSAGKTDHKLVRGLVSDNNITTSIILRNCKIIDVDYEAFENLFHLKHLDLSHNKIQSLKLGVLDGFTQLTYLNMSFNNLNDFPLGLFDQKPNLEILDLKANAITTIELGVFDHLKKLKHVDLSSNLLIASDFNPYLFDQSIQITFMDFSRNDMSEAQSNILHAFQAIEFLNLDRCFLKVVPSFATAANLKTMNHLMLSTNRIDELTDPSTFNELDNLEILNLAYNIIKKIDEKVLWPLKNLKMLVLRDNVLKTIPENLFKDMRNLGNLDLSNNILEYVSVNAFRGTALKNLNLAANRFTFLTNNFCLELRNSGVQLTKFYFNDNPWQCWCLHEILKEVNRYRITYNSKKYNGIEPVCVTSDQFSCLRDMSSAGKFVKLYGEIVLNRKD